MAITDELREYARHLHNVWYDPRGNVYTYTTMDNAPSLDVVRLDEHVLAIADRIDAENERECHEQYACGAEHGIGASIEASMIQDRGYIELPKDADGNPIHIGDVMEFSAFEIEKPVTRVVDGIGQGVFFAWCGERGYQQHEAKRYRHHKQPTVEDVMVEFAVDWESAQDGEDKTAVLKEYAAKLRLVGEDE